MANPHDIDLAISVCTQCGKSLTDLHNSSKGMRLECTGHKGTVHIGYLQKLRVFNKFIQSTETLRPFHEEIKKASLREKLTEANKGTTFTNHDHYGDLL